MTEYTAFRIDTTTLEKLRIIAAYKQRSMAGQVRYLVDQELKSIKDQGLLEGIVHLDQPKGKESVGG